MRRTVLIVPDLLSPDGAESPLRQKLPSLSLLTELGNLSKVAAVPRLETPEVLYLGLSPSEGQMRQGPLTVSALGADPPDRSTHFHLSLMSFVDGEGRQVELQIPPDDLRKIMEVVPKLNTRSLTVVAGEGVDHGLVWEGLGDLGTTPARDLHGKPIRAHLPEGDADTHLRRLIDDSINLLSELELNERRTDQDLPPLNLLWPWGHGTRKPMPNLALRRGERATVESNSMRLAGLTRLTGYVHGDRQAFGRGINTRLAPLAERLLKNEVSIVVIDALQDLRAKGLEEELHWFMRELDQALLKPLVEETLKDPSRLTVIAPGSTTGLAASLQSPSNLANSMPFDERSLEERTLSTRDLPQLVLDAITP
jgi:2,3-bisphosphoglycerate-independent phosphoglycerate mutase